jgi:hypothetical protein
MSHYSDAARKAYIALHHAGGAGTLYADPAPYAAPYSGCATANDRYDFAVNGHGTIAVGGRYTNPSGCHATTCNCEATGIVMLGCFGGCDAPPDQATLAQACGVAYVWAHTGIGTAPEKMRPHRYCDQEDPCNGTYLGTPCPGTSVLSRKKSG